MRKLLFLLLVLGLWGCGDDGAGGDGDADSSDGDLGEWNESGDTANGSVAGAVALSFLPSNVGALAPLEQSPGDLRFEGDSCANYAAIDTSECTISCVWDDAYQCLVATQSDGSEVAVIVANTILVAPNVTVKIEGQRPLVMIAGGDVVINGLIQGLDEIEGEDGVAGGFSSPSSNKVDDGRGPGGGEGGYGGQGSGGGGYCGRGGDGGLAPASAYPVAQGGTPYGNPEIIPLMGGSAGGKKVIRSGGAGGGAIQVVSGTVINVGPLGGISMPGNGGGANAGNGGGAGGAILLEAPEVIMAGVLAVNGGGGGSGGLYSDGIAGRADDQPAFGGVGGERNADGGDGAAGTTVDGQAGEATNENYSTPGGGGGGGVGWIRINTSTGTADISGIISPALETACASTGVINGT